MRTASTLLVGLVAVGLAVNLAGGQGPGRAAPVRVLRGGAWQWGGLKPLVVRKAQPPLAAWDVEGWGRNQAEAEEAALRKARRQVEEFFRQQEPPVAWSPTVAFVRQHLVTGPATRHKDKDQPVGEQREVALECWTIPVAITPAAYRHLAQEERAGRAEGRLVLLGKVLGGLVVLLVGVVGYIRLDEWTKGYYTRWLQAGLAGAVATAGVVLWLWV